MIAPESLLTESFRESIAACLSTFLTDQRERLCCIDADLEPLIDLAESMVAGGKRFRPAFCVAGWLAVRGEVSPADEPGLLQAAASLELLHVSALVHDDVMDGSRLRRGQPAAHVALAARHCDSHARGDADDYGLAGAILLGNLVGMWSTQCYDEATLLPSELDAARPLVAAVRAEVNCGQFLDVTSATRSPRDPGALTAARRVVEYKTSRYTVMRPAQIGAALAGGDQAVIEALSTYGSALGRAFQVRDDVLGVFGDEHETGKPAGDDIREGKRTVLLARAFEGADAQAAATLESLVGKADLTADEVAQAREIIVASGALEAVEADIAADLETALAVVDSAPFHPAGAQALAALAQAAVARVA